MTHHGGRSRVSRPLRPGVEALGGRALLSGLTIFVHDQTLWVEGTERAERVDVTVNVNSVDISWFDETGASSQTAFVRSGFNRVNVLTNGGNDVIAVAETTNVLLPIGLFGGAGNDGLVGGRGPELLVGGEGDDCLWGNGGRDALCGSSGADCLDGGVGTNHLFGGPGRDHIQLVGSGLDAIAFGDEAGDSFNVGPGVQRQQNPRKIRDFTQREDSLIPA